MTASKKVSGTLLGDLHLTIVAPSQAQPVGYLSTGGSEGGCRALRRGLSDMGSGSRLCGGILTQFGLRLQRTHRLLPTLRPQSTVGDPTSVRAIAVKIYTVEVTRHLGDL